MKFISKKNNLTKGFTIIELIVVIAVLGILVLIAYPRFNNYLEKAELARIQNDIKTAENSLLSHLVDTDELPADWGDVPTSELGELASESKLYNKKGLAKGVSAETYKVIDDDFIKENVHSKLKGQFFGNKEGGVYYSDDKIEGIPPLEAIPNEYKVVNDSSFAWTANNNGPFSESKDEYGFYLYTGGEEYVILPETIEGVKVDNYYKMFSAGSSPVKGVASESVGVVNMNNMFESTPSTELSVEHLKTTDTQYFSGMFKDVHLQELDLNYFDFSKAKNTSEMFAESTIPTLEMKTFEAPNLENAYAMFMSTTTDKISFPYLDAPKLTGANQMFRDSKTTSINLHGLNAPKAQDFWSMMASIETKKVDFSNVTLGEKADRGPVNIKSLFENSTIEDLNANNLSAQKVGELNAIFRNITAKNIHANNMEFKDGYQSPQMFGDTRVSETLSVNNLHAPKLKNGWGTFENIQAETLLFNDVDISGESEGSIYNKQFNQAFIGAKLGNMKMKNFNSNSIGAIDQMFVRAEMDSLQIENFNAPSAYQMYGMFTETKIKNISIDGFKASRESLKGEMASNVDNLFYLAKSDSITIDNFEVPHSYANHGLFKESTIGKLNIKSMILASTEQRFAPAYGTYQVNMMFDSAKIEDLKIGKFSAKYSKNWHGMFRNAEIKKMDVKGMDSTGSEDISEMFMGAKIPDIDLSFLNTSSASNFNAMFKNSKMKNIDISMWDMSSIENAIEMFANSVTGDITAPNLKGTTSDFYMGGLLSGAKADSVNLSGFDAVKYDYEEEYNIVKDAQIGSLLMRSQADIDILKTKSTTPIGLNFVLK